MHGLQAMLLLLHSAFMLCVVKMLLKGDVGGCALNSYGNYIVDHGKSWKNHGIVLLNFCGNAGSCILRVYLPLARQSRLWLSAPLVCICS